MRPLTGRPGGWVGSIVAQAGFLRAPGVPDQDIPAEAGERAAGVGLTDPRC
ncbi:MAG TPA: hypothetical protein VGI74_04070 [Streptosporangiaceae bacterium]